ncbi:hypothetical protein CYY_004147 [Polysphondylium violaceum]|uniref:Twinfilin n=1 Tax=Polysphondylium violaceum TaxID=133409 RepID=A0A8J4UZJ8_9MYCE|nr:hypothetical protein CYY_004147 [Polysphondylium violaceum]
MSHSSGIPVSQELISTFGSSNQDNTRFIKVVISEDQLVSSHVESISSDFESDMDKIESVLDSSPCYILFKKDDKSIEVTGCNWIFMFFVPDNAKVREKMTYAATRSTLKRELGIAHFVDEIYSSNKKDFSKKGYKQHLIHQESEAPLTMEEQQKNDEREQGVFVGGGGASMHAHGVAFPVEPKAQSAVQDFINDKCNYISLGINIQDEKIIFSSQENTDINSISKHISTEEPRFHFFRYSHEFEGENLNSIVYIFSCPDGSAGTKSAPVKMRMLYSSSKANVESLVSKSLKIDLKLEINAPSEISAQSIETELHPPKPEEKKAFTRPTRPGAGSRRLVKN